MKTLEEYKNTLVESLTTSESEHYDKLRYAAQVELALNSEKPALFSISDFRQTCQLFEKHPDLKKEKFVAVRAGEFLSDLPGVPGPLSEARRVTGDELLAARMNSTGRSSFGRIHFKDILWVRLSEAPDYAAAYQADRSPVKTGLVIPAFASPYAKEWELTSANFKKNR